ncbi:MAG: anaerobic ribonucleoside-triphosphate reductase activating protein [Clostridia bacterium]|nr:anaerobic ribonucleoside-triphosphate reductase activating protein [Clostridia bacterium]
MNYHNITKDDMLNGEGLRVVLWTAGCSHKCKGCHNPQTWDSCSGILFDETAKSEIFEQLDKSYISGLTLSGGDPLFESNRQEITNLAKEIKQKYPNKTIWCYTGYEYESVKNWDIINYIDVLCDRKFEVEKRDVTAHWVGSTNQRVIDVKQSLSSQSIILY